MGTLFAVHFWLPSSSLSERRLRSFGSQVPPLVTPRGGRGALLKGEGSAPKPPPCPGGGVDGAAGQYNVGNGQVGAGHAFKEDFTGRVSGEMDGGAAQLSDFPSCSFEASALNGKKKNNPLCQPFVAPSSLFPPQSSQTDEIHFVQKAFVYFTGVWALKRPELSGRKDKNSCLIRGNQRGAGGGFLRLSGPAQNSAGRFAPVTHSLPTEPGAEISTGSQNDEK